LQNDKSTKIFPPKKFRYSAYSHSIIRPAVIWRLQPTIFEIKVGSNQGIIAVVLAYLGYRLPGIIIFKRIKHL
jgi:hypothetical protein